MVYDNRPTQHPEGHVRIQVLKLGTMNRDFALILCNLKLQEHPNRKLASNAQ
jgi:hypothetical protein